MARETVLVVDDDEGMRDTLSVILRKAGYLVLTAGTGEEALVMIDAEPVHLVLLDVQMPGMDGIECLRRIKERSLDIEVVIVSQLKDVARAVEAIKLGAFDYLTKEFDPAELPSKVEHALAHRRSQRELAYLRDEVAFFADRELVGNDPTMREVLDLCTRLSSLPATVLILGESGTGKELLARRIHKLGDRGSRPFVAVNLAAIPDELVESTLFGHEKGAFTGAARQHYGKFEMADGGSLFLDEVGDLKSGLQAKLLRVLQEREIERVGGKGTIKVDVRLIAATHRDLTVAVKEGTFREDLFYRLNVVPIKLPPLRDRKDDIGELAQHFVRRHAQRFRRPANKIAPEAINCLRKYNWPGNVRELENLMERLVAVLDKPLIEEDDIPIEIRYPSLDTPAHGEDRLAAAIDMFERSLIRRALEQSHWRLRPASEKLGIGYSTLKRKMSKHGFRVASTPDEENTEEERDRPLRMVTPED